MVTGVLTVKGSIDLVQFWPSGGSDADTVHVEIANPATAFRFYPVGAVRGRRTRVFDGAVVRGKVRKPVLDNKGGVTVSSTRDLGRKQASSDVLGYV